MPTTRRRVIRVYPEGVQQWMFDPTANVRQRHKRRLRNARKHQGHFETFCQVRRLRFHETRTTRRRTQWNVRKGDRLIVEWIPELGRAYVPEMPDVVFKIHDPFVLAWFVDGLLEVEAGSE